MATWACLHNSQDLAGIYSLSYTDSKTKAQRWPKLQAAWGRKDLRHPGHIKLGARAETGAAGELGRRCLDKVFAMQGSTFNLQHPGKARHGGACNPVTWPPEAGQSLGFTGPPVKPIVNFR